jgi:hypothetical protein
LIYESFCRQNKSPEIPISFASQSQTNYYTFRK